MREYVSNRLIKQEDLNHHGTLFAGRTAEWFVEAAFIAAASEVGNPAAIVCLNIHGLVFKSPIQKGEIVSFTTKVVAAGKSSIIVYGRITTVHREISPIEGFITFIHVDGQGSKQPHGLVLDQPADGAEVDLRCRAAVLGSQGRNS